jgi:hypothetical protein
MALEDGLTDIVINVADGLFRASDTPIVAATPLWVAIN